MNETRTIYIPEEIIDKNQTPSANIEESHHVDSTKQIQQDIDLRLTNLPQNNFNLDVSNLDIEDLAADWFRTHPIHTLSFRYARPGFDILGLQYAKDLSRIVISGAALSKEAVKVLQGLPSTCTVIDLKDCQTHVSARNATSDIMCVPQVVIRK